MPTCIIIIPKFVAIRNECMHYEQIYHTPKFVVNSGQGEERDLCVKTTYKAKSTWITPWLRLFLIPLSLIGAASKGKAIGMVKLQLNEIQPCLPWYSMIHL